ncbi:transmembrane protein 71 [Thalassophryne amazonica]|uniref:transmembrane protein 71 n=1 Tax=Thalassophryne amazonica TaxID=390379 RepID=UPI0014714036|nr:transmembrane protein 71 [Thalassophryne amazonica]
MDLFFSGAVTSSPTKRRVLRADRSCQSLDLTLLSPDSSYICYSSVSNGAPCCCRRSPRLLTNGYYLVTEDSFSWDSDGNISLTPCKTNVSYKENLVRVFRRRRRPRSSLARLLSNVTESCQSWLDRKVFRGVFRISEVQNQDWIGTSQDDEPSWAGVGGSFTYDHTELPTPPDKQTPPPKIIQEDICSEICQSKEEFTESLGGLSEVPPPTVFYTSSCCCPTTPELRGLAVVKVLLLFSFTIFIFATLYSRCLMWGATIASTVFIIITAFMYLMKSGPMGEWRQAKTEDIKSRNE